MSDNTKPEVSETAPKKSSQGVSQHFFFKKKDTYKYNITYF